MTYFQPTSSSTLSFDSGSWSGTYHYEMVGPDGAGIWHFTRNDAAAGNYTLGCYYNPTNGVLSTDQTWNSGDPVYLSSTSTPGTLSQISTSAGSDVYGFDSNLNLLFHFEMVEGGSSGSGAANSNQAALTEGFLAINNGVLQAFIPASTPSGNFWIVEGTTPRNGFTHTVLTNTFQIASGWSVNNKSTWILQDGYGAPLATWRGSKKVFTNFW